MMRLVQCTLLILLWNISHGMRHILSFSSFVFLYRFFIDFAQNLTHTNRRGCKLWDRYLHIQNQWTKLLT